MIYTGAMKAARVALYLMAIPALALAAAWFWRDQVVATVADAALTRFPGSGIQALQLDGLALGARHLALDTVRLSGAREGLVFDVTLADLRLDFHWRGLLSGRLGTLRIAQAGLTARRTGAAQTGNGQPLALDTLLPGPYLQGLPVDSVTIPTLQLDFSASGGAALLARGQLAVESGLELALSGRTGGTNFALQLAGSEAKPLALHLELRVDAEPAAAISAELQPQHAREWHWVLAGEARLERLRRVLADIRPLLAASAAAAGDWTVEGVANMTGSLQHPATLPTSDPAAVLALLRAQLELRAQLTSLQSTSLGALQPATLQAQLQLANGDIAVALAPTVLDAALPAQALPLSRAQRDWLGWRDSIPVTLALPQAVRGSLQRGGQLSLQAPQLSLALGGERSNLQLRDMVLQGSAVSAVALQDLVLELRAHLDASLRRQALPPMQLHASYSGDPQAGELRLQLADTAESMRVDLAASAALATGAGRYDLQIASPDLPYALQSVTPLLHNLALLQQAPQLSAGSLRLHSQIDSSGYDPQDWRARSDLALDALSGSFGEYSFEGLDATLDWSGIDSVQTTRPATLTLDRLEVGFAVTDIALQVNVPAATAIDRPKLRIETFSAALFGGELSLPRPVAIDTDADSNSFELQARGWQLQELVALQQGQPIEAQGTLDGELPVTLTGGRVVIDGGRLEARAPGGGIRYEPGAADRALTAGSPELANAVDLLRDFRFAVLGSTVALDREGNLLLGLSLGGHNPAHYGGRRVNFNINLEQNLDPLLQSLRLGDTLVDKVEGKMR